MIYSSIEINTNKVLTSFGLLDVLGLAAAQVDVTASFTLHTLRKSPANQKIGMVYIESPAVWSFRSHPNPNPDGLNDASWTENSPSIHSVYHSGSLETVGTFH